MDLILELANLIKHNNAAGLEVKLTKRGRPRKGARAFTQEDKNHSLVLAMPTASLEVLGTLIRHGAKLTQSSFRSAIGKGDGEREVLDFMLSWGWRVDGRGLWYGESAAEYVYFLSLLGLGVDGHDVAVLINLMIYTHERAAVYYENTLRWLLEHGAELNVVSNPRLIGSCADCVTPFTKAASSGRIQSMEILLEFGAALNPLAIFHAIRWRNANIFSSLAEDEYLMETLRFLVERGAGVDFVAKKWGTPSFYAVHWINRTALEMLSELGADPNVECFRSTAAENARRDGQVELAEVLERRMKRKSRRVRGLEPG